MEFDDGSAPERDQVTGTTTQSGVTIKRTVTLKDKGLLATYRLTTESNHPMRADIIDLLPSRWDSIRFIGVNPDFEPTSSSVSAAQIIFQARIPPEEERLIQYGIQPTDSVQRTDLVLLQNSRWPLFESVESIGEDSENDDEAKEVSDPPLVRGQTQTRELPSVLQSKEAFQKAKQNLFNEISHEKSSE